MGSMSNDEGFDGARYSRQMAEPMLEALKKVNEMYARLAIELDSKISDLEQKQELSVLISDITNEQNKQYRALTGDIALANSAEQPEFAKATQHNLNSLDRSITTELEVMQSKMKQGLSYTQELGNIKRDLVAMKALHEQAQKDIAAKDIPMSLVNSDAIMQNSSCYERCNVHDKILESARAFNTRQKEIEKPAIETETSIFESLTKRMEQAKRESLAINARKALEKDPLQKVKEAIEISL